jgi:hypothetical protein
MWSKLSTDLKPTPTVLAKASSNLTDRPTDRGIHEMTFKSQSHKLAVEELSESKDVGTGTEGTLTMRYQATAQM